MDIRVTGTIDRIDARVDEACRSTGQSSAVTFMCVICQDLVLIVLGFSRYDFDPGTAFWTAFDARTIRVGAQGV
jgi:hypothetical protein